MDEQWLREAVDAWIEEGIITESQGRAILARYGLSEPPDRVRRLPRARLITVLSVMGVGLVAAGIAVFLATIWGDLGRHSQASLVVGLTLATLVAGGLLWARFDRPRIGHVVLTLGSIGVGLAAFSLVSIYRLDVGSEWVYLAWGALVLPIGHGVRSRPIAAVSLTALAGWSVVAADSLLGLGLFGLSVFGVAVFVRTRGHAALAPAYRLVGLAGVLLTALYVLFDDVDLVGAATDPSAALVGLSVAALLAAVGTVVAASRDRTSTPTATWAVAAGVVLGATLGVAVADVAVFGTFVRVLLWHLLTVALLLATVSLGYTDGSGLLVNVAIAAFLAQVAIVLASTVLDALPSAAALIVAGLVLLATGAALERGRRELLGRMRGGG